MNTDRYRSTLIAASVIAALSVGVAACDKSSGTAYDRDSGDSKSAALADKAIAETNLAADSLAKAPMTRRSQVVGAAAAPSGEGPLDLGEAARHLGPR